MKDNENFLKIIISRNIKTIMTQAKIYQIIGTNGQRYIGCTTRRYLCQRMAEHRYTSNQRSQGKEIFCCSSHIVLKDPAAKMELIEVLDYENIRELKLRENWFIDNLKNVVNIRKNVIL